MGIHPGTGIPVTAFLASSREQIPAACILESVLGRPCFLNHAKTRRRQDAKSADRVRTRAGPRGARTGRSRTPDAEIRGHAPPWPAMASAALGMSLGRESRAETRRRGDMGSAPLRLCVSAGGSTSCTGRRSSVASHDIGRCGSGLGSRTAYAGIRGARAATPVGGARACCLRDALQRRPRGSRHRTSAAPAPSSAHVDGSGTTPTLALSSMAESRLWCGPVADISIR